MSAFTTTAGLHFGWEPDALERPAQRDIDYRAAALGSFGAQPASFDSWSPTDAAADAAPAWVTGEREGNGARGLVMAMLLGAAFWAGVAWLIA